MAYAMTLESGEVASLSPGDLLVIRWSGRQGVRGSGAVHRTEAVQLVSVRADGTATLTLRGGDYGTRRARTSGKATRKSRLLRSHRADGGPSTQIVDVIHPETLARFLLAIFAPTHGGAADAADDYDDHGYIVQCVACGEYVDYCQGHGTSGDPVGAAILAAHDADDHTECHPAGCDDAGRMCADCREPAPVLWNEGRCRDCHEEYLDAVAEYRERHAYSEID